MMRLVLKDCGEGELRLYALREGGERVKVAVADRSDVEGVRQALADRGVDVSADDVRAALEAEV